MLPKNESDAVSDIFKLVAKQLVSHYSLLTGAAKSKFKRKHDYPCLTTITATVTNICKSSQNSLRIPTILLEPFLTFLNCLLKS